MGFQPLKLHLCISEIIRSRDPNVYFRKMRHIVYVVMVYSRETLPRVTLICL